jgi:hypothetical protein
MGSDYKYENKIEIISYIFKPRRKPVLEITCASDSRSPLSGIHAITNCLLAKWETCGMPDLILSILVY